MQAIEKNSAKCSGMCELDVACKWKHSGLDGGFREIWCAGARVVAIVDAYGSRVVGSLLF